jgi:drug/metabolite transporter (DMT)-like permease
MTAESTTAAASLPASRAAIPTRAYQVMGIALILGSFSAAFMRLAQDTGMPSLVIAAGRLALAFVILTPLILRNYWDQIQRLTRADWLIGIAAGVWLAIHFFTFISALEYTSIVVTQVIINTSPLWVGLLEMFFLKTTLPRIVWIGLIIALIGGGIIGAASLFEDDAPDASTPQTVIETTDHQSTRETDPIRGGVLALLGAFSTSIYMVIGRKARRKVSAMPYLWILSGSGALTGFAVLLVTQTSPVGYPAEGYFWLFMVTAFAQLGFHAGYNYALGYVSATIASISVQTLSVTAGIVAFIIFAELPTRIEVVGSIIILVGVVIAIWGRQSRTRFSANLKQS